MNAEATKGGEFHRLFLCLQGEWKLVRKYSNGSIFEGIAEFKKLNETSFQLTESGELNLGNSQSQLAAKRQWIWTCNFENQLNITYPPINVGALYHQISLKNKNNQWFGKGVHHCSPDKYFGSYIFADRSFKVEHEVVGPKKDYTFSANYHRV